MSGGYEGQNGKRKERLGGWGGFKARAGTCAACRQTYLARDGLKLCSCTYVSELCNVPTQPGLGICGSISVYITRNALYRSTHQDSR